MDEDLWNELEAQVETHGPQAIQFWQYKGLQVIELNIVDIKFEDGLIQVTLE